MNWKWTICLNVETWHPLSTPPQEPRRFSVDDDAVLVKFRHYSRLVSWYPKAGATLQLDLILADSSLDGDVS